MGAGLSHCGGGEEEAWPCRRYQTCFIGDRSGQVSAVAASEIIYDPPPRLDLPFPAKSLCLCNHLHERQIQSIGNCLGRVQVGAPFLTFQDDVRLMEPGHSGQGSATKALGGD